MGAAKVIYLDSSCLVKVLRPENESAAVVEAIAGEGAVVISVLAELEAMIQLKAGYLAGQCSLPRWRSLEARLAVLHNQSPYEFRTLPAALFQTALRQHRNSRRVHCRTVDRLHLAAMEELSLSRLMTHDAHQAKAAVEAGFVVVQPGRQ